MTDTMRSKTPCPECSGTRWRRWAWVWPIAGGESRWLPVVQTAEWPMCSRVDWTKATSSIMDGADGFDICTDCGLVVR